MDKPPASKREPEPSAGEHEPGLSVREQIVANREAWLRARETVTGEHEVSVHDREQALALREEALRVRAEADAARLERERLLVQMREANEKLVVATLRAEELAEQAVAARVLASETAVAEAEGRRRAEELATELRANEEALRASVSNERENNRAKDDFLAVLGHELRNPLAPIMIALDLVAMDGADAHEREHAIIARQVKQLVHLVDELLDTSRIRSGKITLDRQPIELAEVVSRAVEMAGPLIASHGHVLSVDVPRRGLVVDGDALRLAQVVGNLLTNAAKFTPSGGAIVVTAERRDTTIVLRVRDTGIGISKQMLPRIFDLYAQEQHAPDSVPSGLGLGLAIVRSLVATHGGTVTANSGGLGLGSEFVVTLPASGEHTEASRSSEVAAVPHKILLVEDNRDGAELLADALTRLGRDVRVAFDGPSALAIAQDFVPDVVLLDLGLPGMDGYEVARRLRATLAHHIELIAITAYGQPIDRQRSKAAGFDLHLVKPVDVATLQRSIDESWKRWQ